MQLSFHNDLRKWRPWGAQNIVCNVTKDESCCGNMSSCQTSAQMCLAGSGHPHTWWQGLHCMSLYCINVHSKMFKRHWVLGWSGSLAAIHSTLVLFVFMLEFQYNTLFGSQLFFYLDLKIINRDDICCYEMFSRINIKPIIVKELDSLANKTVINILQGCEMMGKLSIFSLIRFHAKDWWADCHSKLF